MKNLRLSLKIGLGFCALILLILLLGGLAIWQMRQSHATAAVLSDEYAPEIEAAGEIERHAQRVMLNMRGFNLTGDQAWLREGNKDLAEVETHLVEASRLAERSSRLGDLKDRLAAMSATLREYNRLAARGADLVREMDRAWGEADDASERFRDACQSYLSDPNAGAADETGADGQTVMADRLFKLSVMRVVLDLGNTIMLADAESRARRDAGILEARLPDFARIATRLAQLRDLNSQAADLEQLDAVAEAADACRAALEGRLRAFLTMQQTNRQLETAGEAFIASAQAIAALGVSDIGQAADRSRDGLAAAMRVLLGGLAAAVLLGAGVAVILTRAIVTPVRQVMRHAQTVAAGDLNQTLDVARGDEIGVMAEALRGMVGALKEKIGFAEGALGGFTLPCVIVGASGEILWVNRQALDFVERQVAPEACRGMSVGEFYYRDATRQTIAQQSLAQGSRIRQEVVYVTASGLKRVVDITATPISDMDGRLIGAMNVIYDLTEIRAQEEKIRAQAARVTQAALQANDVSGRVASASEELAAQVNQSLRGAEIQKERVGETAVSMEQMTATVLEAARGASLAAETAEGAKVKAQEGAAVVLEAVQSINQAQRQTMTLKEKMGQLGRRAEAIDQVVGVITDIADQTNLLALNAAIEAARAGEAGRGFAVVADEVRKLAEKTMAATREVGETIRGIQTDTQENIARVDNAAQSIETATGLANRSGEALRLIVTMIETAAGQVHSIAAASEQQSAASEQINRAIEEISRISMETAQAMGQSAQAVAGLARQAVEINRIMEGMKETL